MRFKILALALLFWSNALATPTPDSKESAFDALQKSYTAGKWSQVVQQGQVYREKWPKSDRDAALSILLAEANLKLRQIPQAESEAHRILTRFPESPLVGRARIALGEAAMIRGDWEVARREFGLATGFVADTSVVRVAKTHLAEIDGYTAFLKSPAKPASTTKPSVTLLLPLTGANQDISKQYLRGFLWRWKREGFPEPTTLDTEADAVNAVRLFQQAVRDGSCDIVSGGLTQGEAAALAAASTDLEVPFLATYTGAPGLAAIGPQVIQGRPDQRKIGESLARYATEELSLRRFAVVVPADAVSRQLLEGFRNSLVAAGGSIIAEASYYPGSIDFTGAFKQVRETALRYSFDDSLRTVYEMSRVLMFDDIPYLPAGRDLQMLEAPSVSGDETSSKKTLSKVFLDSLWSEQSRRARRWMESTNREIDSMLIPLPLLDGMLMVIAPGTIEIAAPQLARYNLNKRLFGNEAWGEKDALRKVSRYVEGMIYADPLSGASDTLAYDFTKELVAAGDNSLTRAHYAGERAAAMIVAASKATGLNSWRDRLATLQNVATLSGPVSLLREERVVIDARLYRVVGGDSFPIQR